MTLKVNGQERQVDVPADVPLLWVLREELDLPGTKYGCGRSLCGACTVHVAGRAVRSCMMPVGAVSQLEITTIEGLAPEKGLHPVQQAWLDEEVSQCGYCQSGMIMTVAALLEKDPEASAETIASRLTNLCRCGTYPRVLKALEKLRGTNG